MAHMGTLNNSTGKSTPTRSYIAMRPYNNDFFTYTTSTANFITFGSLSPVSGATSLNCKQGALLVETGRKVYPGANPGINTYMVAVFDNSTGLNGFIDPNSTAFTPQNTDRPYYIATGGSNSVDTNSDLAPPVYTHGNIFGSSNLDISGSAMIYNGLTVDNGGTINNGLTVNGGEIVNNGLNVNTGNFTVTAGKVYLPSSIVGNVNMSAGSIVGIFRKLTVTTSGCTSNSKIFLTNSNQNNAGSAYSVEGVTNGSFVIVSNNTSDGSGVNYLIIN